MLKNIRELFYFCMCARTPAIALISFITVLRRNSWNLATSGKKKNREEAPQWGDELVSAFLLPKSSGSGQSFVVKANVRSCVSQIFRQLSRLAELQVSECFPRRAADGLDLPRSRWAAACQGSRNVQRILQIREGGEKIAIFISLYERISNTKSWMRLTAVRPEGSVFTRRLIPAN